MDASCNTFLLSFPSIPRLLSLCNLVLELPSVLSVALPVCSSLQLSLDILSRDLYPTLSYKVTGGDILVKQLAVGVLFPIHNKYMQASVFPSIASSESRIIISAMPFQNFNLKNKITVVTGAGSGINLSFARLAVQQGARVIVADLKLTSDGEKFMKGEGAKNAVFVKCDVTKREDLENLIKVSEKEYGDVPDVYIAGAGVFEPVYFYVECRRKAKC